jgi:hypothetical protein
MTLRKYDADLWTVGHKTVNLFPDETGTSVPHIMCITGPGPQKHTVKIPSTPGLPKGVRTTIEQYLKLTDWVNLLANQESQNNDRSWSSSPEIVACQESQHSGPTRSTDTERLIQNLIHEHSEASLLEEMEDIHHTFSHNTLLSWLIKILKTFPRCRQNTQTTGARFHTLQLPRESVCSSQSWRPDLFQLWHGRKNYGMKSKSKEVTSQYNWYRGYRRSGTTN